MRLYVFSAGLLIAIALSSCSGGASDLAVISKSLKKDVNASTAGGPDLGMSIPSSGSIFWVEGKVKNSGTEDQKSIRIEFRVTDGNTKTVLSAEVPSVPAGKTVDFRTPVQFSQLEMRLIDEEPRITIGR